MNRTTVLGLLACFLVILLGCASEEGEYEKAKQSNTVQAYEDFIKKFPDGKHKSSALERIEELEFEGAKLENTTAGYKRFLAKYLESKLGTQARDGLDRLVWPRTTFGTLVRAERTPKIPFRVSYLTLSGLRTSDIEERAEKGREFLVLNFEGERKRARRDDVTVMKAIGEDGRFLPVYDSLFVEDSTGKRFNDGILSQEKSKCRLAYKIPVDGTGLVWFDGETRIPLNDLLEQVRGK